MGTRTTAAHAAVAKETFGAARRFKPVSGFLAAFNEEQHTTAGALTAFKPNER